MVSPLHFWKTKEQEHTGTDMLSPTGASKAQSVRDKLAAIVRKGNEDEKKRTELYKAAPLSPRKPAPNSARVADPAETARKDRERIEADAKREKERLEFERWEAERKKRELSAEPSTGLTNPKPKSQPSSDSDSDDKAREAERREELRLLRALSSRK